MTSSQVLDAFRRTVQPMLRRAYMPELQIESSVSLSSLSGSHSAGTLSTHSDSGRSLKHSTSSTNHHHHHHHHSHGYRSHGPSPVPLDERVEECSDLLASVLNIFRHRMKPSTSLDKLLNSLLKLDSVEALQQTLSSLPKHPTDEQYVRMIVTVGLNTHRLTEFVEVLTSADNRKNLSLSSMPHSVDECLTVLSCVHCFHFYDQKILRE